MDGSVARACVVFLVASAVGAWLLLHVSHGMLDTLATQTVSAGTDDQGVLVVVCAFLLLECVVLAGLAAAKLAQDLCCARPVL